MDNFMPLIEIMGDVWLLADVIGIRFHEDREEIVIVIRNREDATEFTYEFSDRDEAKSAHLRLVTAWKNWLTT